MRTKIVFCSSFKYFRSLTIKLTTKKNAICHKNVDFLRVKYLYFVKIAIFVFVVFADALKSWIVNLSSSLESLIELDNLFQG